MTSLEQLEKTENVFYMHWELLSKQKEYHLVFNMMILWWWNYRAHKNGSSGKAKVVTLAYMLHKSAHANTAKERWQHHSEPTCIIDYYCNISRIDVVDKQLDAIDVLGEFLLMVWEPVLGSYKMPIGFEFSSNMHMYLIFGKPYLFLLIYDHLCIACLADIFLFPYLCQ